jgi:hypothetical protein
LTVQTAPARLDDEKWILLGGLAAIFAVGVGLLLRRPTPELAAAPASTRETGPGPRKRKTQRPAPEKPAPPARVVQQVSQEVNTNLDSLKDMLLRLELRRQAGKISEEEYVRERERAEQLLRELVQG